MPNLRSKTWTTTTLANVEDAQHWEDHLISDADAAKIASSVQSVNGNTPDAYGNVDVVALPDGGTLGQVLTKQSSLDGDADWEDPASSGHTIIDENGDDMPYRTNLQFTNAEVTDDSVNDTTIVDCKGEKGDPGQAATITVGNVTTLPAGSSATVTNTGTTSSAVFDFGIPKGADGTGAGDMLKADYDPNSVVELAGGITDYVASQAYTLPTAASNVLGGVKVGTNLSIDANGVLSATSAGADALVDLTDVSISLPSNNQVLRFNSTSSKWENGNAPSGGGGSEITITTTEATLHGRTVTLTDNIDTYTGTFDNTGKCVIQGVTIIGTATVSASDGIETASNTVTMPYYGKYTVAIKFFSATVNVTFPYSNGATCTLSDGVTTLTATTSPMAFAVKNTGIWTATVLLDGQSKEDSVQITTDGQTASLTIEYGTINLTYDNSLRGNTITCTIGSKTITKIAPNNANAMVFYPPITGNWAITTQIGQAIVASTPNPVVVSSLSTPVSASIQGNLTLTVTIYSATEDTVSFTDISGAKIEAFESGQSSKTVSIVIPPTGMNITFESSVGKNPADLSEYFSKTVAVDNNTTEVYVMPDNCLYWYGYVNGIEDCNVGGWSSYASPAYAMISSTFNTNSINIQTSGAQNAGVYGTGAISGSAKLISQATYVNQSYSFEPWIGQTSTKTMHSGTLQSINNSSINLITLSNYNNSNYVYVGAHNYQGYTVITVYALWIE